MTPTDPTIGSAGPDPMDGSREPSALGASPSTPAEPRRRARGRGGSGGRSGGDGGGDRRRLSSMGPLRGLTLIVVAALLLALVPAFLGGLKKTPKDRVGISYGGGPIEATHFQKIVQPGSRLFFNGFFDPLYLYPADQQNYIVSAIATEGAKRKKDAVVAPTKDRVQVSYQLAVYFKLNTDLLRPFHEQFGLKYKAYTPAGWNALINDTFRQQIENSLQEETRRYTVADLYGNADLLVQIQNDVQTRLSDRLELAMGKLYFCAPTWSPGRQCDDPTFVIKAVGVPSSVVSAFEANRTSEINILTKKNELKQREVEAQSIRALGVTGDVYALLKAIESGGINFWVLPSGGGGVTLTTPNSAGGSTSSPGTGTSSSGTSGSGSTATSGSGSGN